MSCRVTQDGWVMVESYDKLWSTGERNGRPFHHSCLENPVNSVKRQKDMILLEKSREISPEGMKRLSQSRNNVQLWVCLVVNVKTDAVKNNTAQEPVRSLNQGNLEVVKQEMARVNTDILGISELKWVTRNGRL